MVKEQIMNVKERFDIKACYAERITLLMCFLMFISIAIMGTGYRISNGTVFEFGEALGLTSVAVVVVSFALWLRYAIKRDLESN